MNKFLRKIPLPSPVKALLCSLIAGQLLLFGYSFALSLAEAPSPGMSREVPLGTCDYGFSKTGNSHILTLPEPDGSSALIFAVDGEKTKTMVVDLRGRLRDEALWDLDLSGAFHIEASRLPSGRVRLIYQHGGLYRTDWDPRTGFTPPRLLRSRLNSFSSSGSAVAFSTEEGLFLLSTETPGEDAVRLLEEQVYSFRIVRGGEKLFLLAVVDRGAGSREPSFFRYDDSFRLETSWEVPQEGEPAYFQTVKDLHWRDGVLSALFFHRRSKEKIHYITVQRYDGASGRMRQQARFPLAFYRSRYEIVHADEESLLFFHQTEDSGGVNLAGTRVFADGRSQTDAYTKTRSMSKFGGYFRSADREAVVFSDIDHHKRSLFFASGDPGLIAATTSLKSVGFWHPFATTFLMFLVTLVMGSLYLLVQLPLPAVWCLLGDRLSLNKAGEVLFPWTILLLHTGVKILVSLTLAEGSIGLLFRPFFGGGRAFYGVLFLSGLIPFLLVRWAGRSLSLRDNSYLDLYFPFALWDYLQYAALFLIYLCSSLFLGKI